MSHTLTSKAFSEAADRDAYRFRCIEQYIDAGYGVFPVVELATPQSTKKRIRPAMPGWKNAKTDLKYIEPEALGLAFGVVLTDKDVVLDVDPGRFVNGVNQLTELWRVLELPKQFENLIVKTWSGGYHLYFRKPKHLRFKNGGLVYNGLEFPAIDIKTKGGFVVGAGSIIRGKQYRIARGGINNITELP
jgi:hypothetical protein